MITDKARLDLAKGEISKSAAKKTIFRGATFNLLGKWVKTEEDLPPYNKDTVIVNSLDICVRFFVGKKGLQANKPYCVYTYLFDDGRCRCKDWNDLLAKSKEQTKEGKVLAFLLKYTNLCSELFYLAYINMGLLIPIGFDTLKYVNDISGDGWMDEPVFGTKDMIDIERVYYIIKDEARLEKLRKDKEEYRRRLKENNKR